MPRIEPYRQRTNVTGATEGTGEIVAGRGLAAVGAAINDVGDSVALVARRDAANVAAEALADLRVRTTKRMLDAQNGATADAAGFTDGVLSGFDSELADVLDGANTRLSTVGRMAGARTMARAMVREHATELRAELAQRAMQFEAETRGAYRSQSILDSAQRLAAVLENDPSQWSSVGSEQMEAINALELDPAARLALMRGVDALLSEGAATGRAKRSPLETMQALTKAGDELLDGLSLDARHRVEQRARAALVDQSVARVLKAYEGGPEAGIAALATVMQRDDIPPDLRAEIRARANGEVSALRTQRREEHADELTALERNIASGAAGPTSHAAVDTLYSVAALSAAERANYHAAIDSAIVRQARDNAGAVAVFDALSQGLPLDPKDADQRKAFAAAFEQDAAGASVGSPEWQGLAQAYAGRARMLPDQATSWVRQALRSPDPALAANAAQFYGAVNAAVPDAVGELDTDTRAFAATVNGMIEAGTPPARAVETARSIVFDVKPELIERRRDEYREHVKSSAAALSSFIDRDFDPGWFSSEPAASTALSVDFEAQAGRYFAKVGDIGLARELAWEDLRRVYGPTRVNGEPVVMAFPVERFGVTPEEVRTEVGAFLKDNPQADGSTAADVLLVPDALTLRQVGDALNGQAVRPSYRLVGKSGDLVLDRDGVPLRYTIPTGEELGRRFREAQAAADAEAQRRVDEARAKREQREQERREFAERLRRGELPTTSD